MIARQSQHRHACSARPLSTFGVQIFARQDGFPGYNVPTGRLNPRTGLSDGGPVSPYSAICFVLSAAVYSTGGRMVALQPLTQIVSRIVACVTSGSPWPAKLNTLQDAGNYYSSTLQLLSLVAVKMRAPSCLQG